jgi:hypothetical protein
MAAAGAGALTGGMGGVDTGGGSISPSSSASSSNKGGNNSLGGFGFGDYNKTDYTLYIIIGVAVVGGFLLMRSGKR